MKASVIIPCHPKNLPTLPRTLDSVERAAKGIEVERIVVSDGESKGPSWARNRGLDRAAGQYVFFVDADDEVEPDFFRRPLGELESSGADLAFFTYAGGPRLASASVTGNDAVRDRYLPAFFGYSMDDVRRWNAGGSLARNREPGQVWRCAYRRDFLELNRIRFDERLTLFEDAAFLSECCAFARHAVSMPDELYRYRPASTGNLATGWKHERYYEYKFLVHDFRLRLDSGCGGRIWRYCEASAVFSAFELLKTGRFAALERYLALPQVRKSLLAFPLSPRHPLAAAAWFLTRAFAAVAGGGS